MANKAILLYMLAQQQQKEAAKKAAAAAQPAPSITPIPGSQVPEPTVYVEPLPQQPLVTGGLSTYTPLFAVLGAGVLGLIAVLWWKKR